MVQTYGIAKDDDGLRNQDAAGGSRHSEETSALLGPDATARGVATKADGPAGLTSSVGNLANTIIGSGMYITSSEQNHITKENHRNAYFSSCKRLYLPRNCV